MELEDSHDGGRQQEDGDGEAPTTNRGFCQLPDEILLEIFLFVGARDLCSLSSTCKRFNCLVNEYGVWKKRYQDLFEYDLPLLNPEPFVFCFAQPDESRCLWKESYRQLYHGYHVYLEGEEDQECRVRLQYGRQVMFHGSLIDALSFSLSLFYHTTPADYVYPICFIHPGAGSGDIAKKVSLSLLMETTQPPTGSWNSLIETHASTYLGYMTLTTNPSNLPPYNAKINLVDVRRNPNIFWIDIDHCLIGPTIRVCTTETGGVMGVFVEQQAKIKDCHITNCDKGIFVNWSTSVREEDWTVNIARIQKKILKALSGPRKYRDIVISSNEIFDCDVGIDLRSAECSAVDNNHVHHNRLNVELTYVVDCEIIKNRIFNGEEGGISIELSTQIQISNNEFASNNLNDVEADDHTDVVLWGNLFDGPSSVVSVQPGCLLTMEGNQFCFP